MTPEERFTKFFESLQKSNPIWWDNLKVPFGKKDFAAAAQEVWLILHSEGKITKDMDWQYARSLMQRKLTWAPDKDQVIAPPKAEVVIHPEALTGDERQKKLEEWKNAHLKSDEPLRMQINPYKDLVIQHQPPKGYKYRPLSPEEIYRRDRHLEYVKYCFDPKTAQPNSNWMPESEFNDQFEKGLI